MSMAFLRDGAEGEMPAATMISPSARTPSSTALRLRSYVEEFRAAAEAAGDDRLEQVARRYLR